VVAPYPSYSSRLQKNAQIWGIELQKADNAQLVILYFRTLAEISTEFNSQRLDDLARNQKLVDNLGEDVGEILNALYSVASGNREFRGVMNAIPHLEKAREELAIAFILFDESEVTDAVQRIRARVPALNAFGQGLRRVIESWPSKFKS